jgi:uncharacterized protein YdeI (BOF family)
MQRVRRAVVAALVPVVALCASSVLAAIPPLAAGVARAAVVPWPASSLVVSEVQTGGAGASDEFVEIANQGGAPVDLIGLEVVYATSSGTTVTRKATWAASTVLAPGQRSLIVNSAGALAGLGDASYTGGFAATGGALALRVVGGSVVDAIGWGDATNAFVEGTVAMAPPPSSSLERRPGGPLGNGVDTNDNASDWFVSTTPGPQGLSAPPVPDPGATPSPAPTLTPTPEPSPTPSSSPTESPQATPSPSPSPTPEPSTTPSPTPSMIPVAVARSLPDGTQVAVTGVLTTDLGALEAGRTAFIQDTTGGIAVYLDAVVSDPLPAGTQVRVSGSVDDRFAQRTLRAVEGDIVVLDAPGLPVGSPTLTGSAVEAVEGTRLVVDGTIVAGPDALADGTAVTVDDGSGPLRVIVTPGALDGRVLDIGSRLVVVGPLGQRDSSGTGAEGYRLYVIAASDLTVVTPSPSPEPTPEPSQTATPGPTATPSAEPSPTPTPAPTPSPSSSPSAPVPTIASARAMPVGSTVTVRGVVTAEAGRLGTPALFAIADATGGIVVKLPSGGAPPARGRIVLVTGHLADPFGQLEVRPSADAFATAGTDALPAPIDLPASGPGEASEGRLVRLSGVVTGRPTKATSGDITLTLETTGGTRVKVMADASSGLRTGSFTPLARYRVTGVGGQRASRKGAPDGYRIWARDPRDVVLLAAAPTSTPRASGSPKTSGATPSPITIGNALKTSGRPVAIEAVVTAPASILDATGRRVVVQDASGAIEVLLPKDVTAPGVGARIRVVGTVGKAYGAPRLRATDVDRRGSGAVPAALRVVGPLTAAHTWRLVTVSGRVEDVRKLGDRWRAELATGAHRLVVIAQPGARIAITALAEGGTASIIGIVRPAYPTASDRRPSILPRSSRDIQAGHAPPDIESASAPSVASSIARSGGSSGIAPGAAAVVVADLIDLESSVGTRVGVGGLVVDLRPDGFTLDDGTAVGRVVLTGEAGASLDLIEPGDAINVVGTVTRQLDGEVAVVVDDPAEIALGSALDDGTGATSDQGPSASPSGPSALWTAGIGEGTIGLPGAGAGLAGLLAVSLLSLGAAAIHRRQVRRLLAVRIAARLAAIGGAPPPDRPTADRSGQT